MSTREDLKRFYALDIDFGKLGLYPQSHADARYFCTPEDAECFGGPGVDGVHYCLLPGEETVYVVRPSCGEEGQYVLPVAEDFREFLSFLLYCGAEAALEQMPLWDTEEAFQAYLREQEQDAETQAVLDVTASAFGVEPEDPYEKVKALQASFDPSRLRFSGEYYDVLGLEDPRHPEGDIPAGRELSCSMSVEAERGGGAALSAGPHLWLEFVNARLRDTYFSLEELCDSMTAGGDIEAILAAIGYHYDPEENQFIRKS